MVKVHGYCFKRQSSCGYTTGDSGCLKSAFQTTGAIYEETSIKRKGKDGFTS